MCVLQKRADSNATVTARCMMGVTCSRRKRSIFSFPLPALALIGINLKLFNFIDTIVHYTDLSSTDSLGVVQGVHGRGSVLLATNEEHGAR